jgi:uracil-DNA glycosylase
MTRAERRAALDRLHRRMRRCRRCLELGCSIVPPAIFTGGIGARVMIVGQAPGSREVEADRPFHAQSGSRLFQWLGEAGFDEGEFRARQYMTSVTKCFPGKAAAGGGDRRPTSLEVETCRPFLIEQLALVRPELVIPVGKLAIDEFFALHPPLEEVVGTRHILDARVVIPLPHPSGASRWHQIPENRKKIDRAIQLLAEERSRLGL